MALPTDVRRLLLAAAALFIAACAAPTETRFGTFFGIFYGDDEVSSFRYCMSAPQHLWWLVDDHGLLAAHLPVVAGQPRSAFMIVNGELSPGGHYGIGGGYIHELRVREVVEVSQDTVGKCILPPEPS